eukprot:3827667-Lingulodinium_polyedra.AAC.1
MDYRTEETQRTMSMGLMRPGATSTLPLASAAPLPLAPWSENPLSLDDAAFEAWAAYIAWVRTAGQKRRATEMARSWASAPVA